MAQLELPPAQVFTTVSEEIDEYLKFHELDPTKKIPIAHQTTMLDQLARAEQNMSYLDEGTLLWAQAPTVLYSNENYGKGGIIVPLEEATVRGAFEEFILTTFSGLGIADRHLSVMALLRGEVASKEGFRRGYIQVPLTHELKISYCSPEDMN